MHQRYQDAMAVVRELGKPSLFITFTCNPKWPEIVESCPPGVLRQDCPQITCRVFKAKLDDFMKDLTVRGVLLLGQSLAHIQVIEFQKRGHMRTFWSSCNLEMGFTVETTLITLCVPSCRLTMVLKVSQM